MNRSEMLLVQLGEEAAEVVKEVSKCLRFGPEEIYAPIGISNAERVGEEVTDLIALVEMLIREKVLPQNFMTVEKIEAKKKKVELHLTYSIQCGTLTSPPT